MAKCKKCGNICSSHDKFCTNCGKRTPREFETRCPKCDRLIFVGENFCRSCGEKINKKKLIKKVIKK